MTADPARSTPHGFWMFSADYLLAARCVDTHIRKTSGVYFPTLNLYGIAIELSLKAFLLKRGKSLDEIKNLSHNLTKTLTLARTHKLGRVVKLERREIAAIHGLNITYSSNKLRYIVTGIVSVPNLVYISRAAEELVVGLEEMCTGRKGKLNNAL